MTRTTSKTPVFTRLVTIALIVFFTPIFVFGATIAMTGLVTVHVDTADGPNVYVPVPAILFDIAVLLAPLAMPEDALDDVRREIAPYQPALEDFADELNDIPSGVLVEYRGKNEHVQVTKTWRSYKVDVDSEDADVSVSVPSRLMRRALDVL